MRLESLGAVHTPCLYGIDKKEINNIEIEKKGLCQNDDRHKQ